MRYHSHWIAKSGDCPEEYEDALAADPQLGRFAVADGATESAFAASWARLLVERFVQAGGCQVAGWKDWLPSAQGEWAETLRGRELPWYAEAKAAQGAFATFLGVWLTGGEAATYRWRAVAVGDACLFRTRGPKLLDAFPLDRSEQFGSSPNLVGSRTPLALVAERAVEIQGDAEPEDRLWMMTDALAQWFLRQCEDGHEPWMELQALDEPAHEEAVQEALSQKMLAANADRFGRWIEGLRSKGRLRNDDVTLLTVIV